MHAEVVQDVTSTEFEEATSLQEIPSPVGFVITNHKRKKQIEI